jgi:hypothetical protein
MCVLTHRTPMRQDSPCKGDGEQEDEPGPTHVQTG